MVITWVGVHERKPTLEAAIPMMLVVPTKLSDTAGRVQACQYCWCR